MLGSMREFDIIVVGSGPAAVAALHGLSGVQRSGVQRIGVVTGDVPSAQPSAQLHPKIQAVVAARGESAGVTEPLAQADRRSKPFFSTAAIGGLANYWGQQFVRFLAGDPWPNDLFDSYSDYEAECETIEALFCVEGGKTLDTRLPLGNGFGAWTSRLLTGTSDDALAGLLAMRHAYRALEEQMGATGFDTRAHAFEPADGRWRILLEGSEPIFAHRVLLAAGVVGGARLLLRSYRDLSKARFSDHSPWMLYAIGPLLAARSTPASRHFNAMTIEQVKDDQCAVFASVYDLRRADLNLLLASTVGRTLPLLRGWPAPPGSSLVKPVQIWTPGTGDVIEIDALTKTMMAFPRPSANPKADGSLMAAIDVLRGLGARVLKIGRTEPGFGFHYHALEVKSEGGGPFKPVADLLRERTNGSVAFADASVLKAIGQRPHTLTAMASARRIAQAPHSSS